MSRIDEALKRARAGMSDAGSAATPPAGAPDAITNVPAQETFEAPWTFGAEEAPAPALQAAPVPTGEPPAEAAVPLPSKVWEALLAEPAPAPSVAAATPVAAPDLYVTPAATPAVSAQFGHAGESQDGEGMILFQGLNPSVVEKVVSTPEIRPVFAEQYRKLAGVLHHAQLERNLKVIVVTSALASEGKTLTSTNLALTLSESFRRSVLLIDADLRKPTLHEIFQVPNVVGLGDGLRADTEQKLSLVQVSPKLTLLTAGRPDPDPMSGLSSDRMRRVIEEATARFEWVIVDTPPVGLLPDAKILAQMADSVLFVVHAGRTPYTIIQRGVAAIGRERILGVVLNRTDAGLDGSYGYSSYYYGYGERDTK
jgi:capsular exopolysaccharide synthesis family protein